MKYLCLVYLAADQLHAVPDLECKRFGDELRSHGRMVAGEALHPTSTATTVRVRNGQLAITDGPFAETKEQLAGFYLVDAVDLNAAIAIAARIPPARAGSVEVRPVRELQDALGRSARNIDWMSIGGNALRPGMPSHFPRSHPCDS